MNGIPAIVAVSDLHLTDRPEDEYRWNIFQALMELGDQLSVEGFDPINLYILGDLTDRKDNHSAAFVHRVLDRIDALAASPFGWVRVLCGNHDYLYEEHPYFEILNFSSFSQFISKPEIFVQCGFNILALPHRKDPEWSWKQSQKWSEFSKLAEREDEANVVLCHQTFKGAQLSTGVVADSGCSPSIFDDLAPMYVISGDVHVPQKLGRVMYVGSPYPVNYGDEIEGGA